MLTVPTDRPNCCPTCGGIAEWVCSCPVPIRRCENRHHWTLLAGRRVGLIGPRSMPTPRFCGCTPPPAAEAEPAAPVRPAD